MEPKVRFFAEGPEVSLSPHKYVTASLNLCWSTLANLDEASLDQHCVYSSGPLFELRSFVKD